MLYSTITGCLVAGVRGERDFGSCGSVSESGWTYEWVRVEVVEGHGHVDLELLTLCCCCCLHVVWLSAG